MNCAFINLVLKRELSYLREGRNIIQREVHARARFWEDLEEGQREGQDPENHDQVEI